MTYMVQYKIIGKLAKWHDDKTFSTVRAAIDYAVSEAAMCHEHEHRVVRTEVVTLATFGPMGADD